MEGFIDLHCHVLPGIDDGAADMTETVKMLTQAWNEGVREIIVTPHFFASKKNASRETVQDIISQVKEKMKELDFFIQLYPGNEIYYRSEIEDLIEAGQVNTMAGSQYVLVEFDPMTEYNYLRNGILKLSSYGYVPVLAHTERYQCLFDKKERLERIKEHGALIQVNASSFLKGMFDVIGKRARYIMKKDILDFIATDAHSSGSRCPKMKEAADYLVKKMGREKAERILFYNPRAILENRSL